jgi:hypothetical protein
MRLKKSVKVLSVLGNILSISEHFIIASHLYRRKRPLIVGKKSRPQ